MKIMKNAKLNQLSVWIFMLLIGAFIISMLIVVAHNIFLPDTEPDTEDKIIMSEEDVPIQYNLDDITSGAVQRIEQLYQPNRNSYGEINVVLNNRTQTIQIKELIEKNLPPLPSDFWKVKYAFITYPMEKALCNISPEYYLQPEWVDQPSKYVQIMIPYIKSGLNKTIWYRSGVGGYPSIHRISTYPGAKFNVCTFIFSGWRVETYQGVSIYPAFANKVIWDESFADMKFADSNGVYNVTVNNPDILLGPNYPTIQNNWIQKVVMTVEVADDAPPGIYAYNLQTGPAPSDMSEKWRLQYLERYNTGSLFIGNVPVFQAIVEVR